ncbi:hypothetical protein GALL_55560 [mine drainage metagenome]|uniref:Uncharacterized protein n=1 Tax=mine drainage metagenome TaxID=410659 RepID=A0A1J5SZ01_9ZZZZ
MFITKDNLKLGLVLGLLAPFIGMFGFYFWKFGIYPFKEFLFILGQQKSLITAMVSFSLLMNAILFTIYINAHKDETAKGIFIVTIVYAVAALALKFLL